MYDSTEEIFAQDSLNSLKSQIPAKGVIPFVGAGMSVSFGYPSWRDFLEENAPIERKDEVRNLLQRGAYEEAAEVLLETGTYFNDKLKTVFGRPPQRSSENCPIELLPTLFPSSPIFTTNFDRVLEEVYSKQGKPLGTRTSTVRQMLEFREHVLIKLHGDFSDDESRVLTLRDYVNHYGAVDSEESPSEKPLLKALLQVFSTESALFLGCGLRNDRYLRLLRKLAARTTHYAVIPYDAQDDRTRLFGECNIRPILYSPGQNHRFVSEILLFLSGKRMLQTPAVLTLNVRLGTELLQAIRSRWGTATVGVPSFEDTAFSSALLFRNDSKPATLTLHPSGDGCMLQASPRLRIPFTQLQRDIVNLNSPADEIREYDFLPTTPHPIRVIIEPDPSCAVVLTDEERKLSVRVILSE